MRYLYLSVIWAMSLLPAFGQGTANLSAEDVREIRGEARKLIETHLNDLMNTIASEGMGEISRRVVLVNSFLPSDSQVFDGPGVIIEDDTNPEYTINKTGYPDMKVQSYLESLNLYYTKSESYSIKITEVFVSNVMQGANFPYVLVHYKSQFTNAHRSKPNIKYVPVHRTAEVKAEKNGSQWKVFITGIRYYREPAPATTAAKAPEKKTEVPAAQQTTQKLTPPASPNTTKEPGSAPVPKTQAPVEKTAPAVTAPQSPEKSPASGTVPEEKPVTKAAEKSPELVPERVSKPMSALEIRAQKHQKQSLLFRAGAGMAVLGAAATYFVLNNAYGDYKSSLEQSNRNLEAWWNTNSNGQNFGSIENYKAQPKSLIGFATPGIYLAGAAIAGGVVLFIAGSSSSKKAKELRKQLQANNLSISPQAGWSQRYAGLHIRYQF